MAERKHKIFTHCNCEQDDDTYTKVEVSKDISNLLMYMRMIDVQNRQIKNIRDRKDRLTDDKQLMLDQMEIDVKRLYVMIQDINSKYIDE